MDFTFVHGQEKISFSLENKEGKYIYTDQNGSLELEIKEISPGVLSILAGEKSFLAAVVKDKEKIIVSIDGCRFEFQEAETTLAGKAKEEIIASGIIAVKAPMPGKVVKIIVGEGERVRQNQTLAIVEAMKMENEIKATVEGIIKKIYIAEGELVDSERPLIELEAST